MNIFIDTSALLAILDRDDKNNPKALEVWKRIASPEYNLFCTNYVLVETFALVQHRLGMKAARVFAEDILPIISIEWVGESEHRASMSAFLAAGRKRLSFVDCVSFETMRNLGLKTAFVFDSDFQEQGFDCLP